MHYEGQSQAIREIAQQLNVDAVVEGSVLRVEGRGRISAQLIHASTDEHVWAESYERDFGDVLSLEREIAPAAPKTTQWLAASHQASACSQPLARPDVCWGS